MTTTESARTKQEASLGHDVLLAIRYYLGGRRGLVVLASAIIASGLAFNWTWLVAAGIAPILLSALPCVAMCVLGLCMSGNSCSTEGVSEKAMERPDGQQVTPVKPESDG